MKRLKVYVAGPYTKGDVCINVRTAIKVADQLATLGFVPFIPHLTHFWHLLCPRPYEFWLDYDIQFLECCDVLLRIPGESSGANKEVALAVEMGLPVVKTVDEVLRLSKEWGA